MPLNYVNIRAGQTAWDLAAIGIALVGELRY